MPTQIAWHMDAVPVVFFIPSKEELAQVFYLVITQFLVFAYATSNYGSGSELA